MAQNAIGRFLKEDSNETLGRYATATTPIRAGQIILEERPFVVGPKSNTESLCLECYCPVSGGPVGSRCPKCSWPLCAKCSGLPMGTKNHAPECVVFHTAKVRFQNVEGPCAQLECITPLRMLLAKEADESRWQQEIHPMEDHAEERRGTNYWEADMVNIVGFLRGPCGLAKKFSVELIQKVCGILEVNAFEGRSLAGHCFRMICPKVAILAHSCVPNTIHSIYRESKEDDYTMILRATVDIQPDEMVFVTYTYTLEGTALRQNALKTGKFFTCLCNRCVDPTEMGTHFSSLQCSKCVSGLILPMNALDHAKNWKCNDCNFSLPGTVVGQSIAIVQQEIEKANALAGVKRIQYFENLLNKYRVIFHPQHYILTNIQYELIQMYGTIDGYKLNEMPPYLLRQKIDFCSNLLKIIDVLEPGFTRSRGHILYEMHAPLVLLARINYEQEIIGIEAFKQKLRTAIEHLTEAIAIFDLEDESTAEGELSVTARMLREEIQDFIAKL